MIDAVSMEAIAMTTRPLPYMATLPRLTTAALGMQHHTATGFRTAAFRYWWLLLGHTPFHDPCTQPSDNESKEFQRNERDNTTPWTVECYHDCNGVYHLTLVKADVISLHLVEHAPTWSTTPGHVLYRAHIHCDVRAIYSHLSINNFRWSANRSQFVVLLYSCNWWVNDRIMGKKGKSLN